MVPQSDQSAVHLCLKTLSNFSRALGWLVPGCAIAAVLFLAAPARAQQVTTTIGLPGFSGETDAIAINPESNTVYVSDQFSLNFGPGLIYVINGTTNAVINTITPGNTEVQPYAIAVDTMRNKLFIANIGGNVNNGNITVIDLTTSTPTDTVVADPNGLNPQSLVFDVASNTLYVSNRNSSNISVFNFSSSYSAPAVSDISLSSPAGGLALNPNPSSKYLYATTTSGVYAYNIATPSLSTTITQASGAGPIAVDTNQNTAYAANGASVYVINGATYSTTISDASLTTSTSIAVNPNTHRVYVSGGGPGGCQNGCVSIYSNGAYQGTVTTPSGDGEVDTLAIDTSTDIAYATQEGGKVTVINGVTANDLGDLPVSGGSEVVGVNPITHKAYASAGGGIAVIDGATNQINPAVPTPPPTAPPISVGSEPWAIAVNPVTNKIFVANYNDSNVSVIDGSSNSVTTVGTGEYPDALVVDPVNNLVYVDNFGGQSITVIDASTLPSANTYDVTFNTAISPDSIAFNPVLNQVYGASSAYSLGFAFGGGAYGQSQFAGGFAFGGATPLAVGTNPANGVYYTLLKTGTYAPYLTVSDAAPYGFYVDVCSNGGVSPVAMDVNTVTSTVFVACTDGTIYAVQGATGFTGGNTTVIPANPSFSPNGVYSAIAVNSLTNLAYAADYQNGYVYVIDGSSNSNVARVTVGYFPVSIAVNVASNKIYVLCAGAADAPPVVTIIDGATNTVLGRVQIATSNFPLVVNNTINEIAANPATGDIYSLEEGQDGVFVLDENTSVTTCLLTSCLQTIINPLPSNTTNYTSPTITFTATNTFDGSPVNGVYFQLDTQQGAWTPATVVSGTLTASLSNVAPGFHILYAFATDEEDATASTFFGNQASPLTGPIASYGFLVAPPIAIAGPASSDFGNVSVGSSSANSQNLIIANTGGAPMTYSYAFSGDFPNDFVVNPNGYQPCSSSGTIPANSYCQLTVNFAPSTQAAETATLTFTDNSLAPNANSFGNTMQTINLSGNGIFAAPTFTENPGNPSYVTSGQLAYIDPGAGANPTFRCSLVVQYQSPSYSPCSSSYSYSGLAENTYYTFSVTANDGTNDSSPLTWTWEVVPSQVSLTINGTGSGTVVSTNPTGLSCSVTCNVQFNGVPVTLSATPNAGSVFAGWSNVTPDPNDSCSGTGSCLLQTGDSNQSATATFNSNVTSTTLTVSELGTGTGSVTGTGDLSGPNINCSEASGISSGTCSATYSSTGTAFLTEAPSGGSTFVGWTGCDTVTGNQCSLSTSTNRTVTANFIPPPITVTVTFPVSSTPVTETATYNCPGNPSAGLGNPCTMAQGPNATSVELTAQAVNTSFKVSVTATEVPPSIEDGICEKVGGTVNDGSAAVAADFDCRFLQFFNYGTDPTTAGAIVPLCVPYSNGNCIHYEVSSPTGGEPDPSSYLGPVNWVLTWNSDTVAPPSNSYWSPILPNTTAIPQLYDDPDYAPIPQSAVGTSCTSPMTINGVNQSYYCQFEFDITTFYDASEPVDAGVGGTTRQFNDVVVAWPPTNVPNNSELPLLNANSAPDNSTVTYGSGGGVGFTISLTNNGVTTATGVLITDPLPSGSGVNWTLAGAPTGFGCAISGTNPNQSLICTSPLSIAPGSGGTLVFHLTSPTPVAGIYSNVATFTIGTQQTLAVATFSVQALATSFSKLSSYTITYGQSTQTITGTISAGSSYPPAGESVTVTVGSTSAPATITGTNGAFSVAFPTATIPASATPYAITYKYPGDGNFLTATNSGSSTLTVNKANQTITFPAPASPATYNASFPVSATSTSLLTVSIGASGACSISSGTVTMTSGTGTCTLTASQAGNTNYNPATNVVHIVTAALASQSITFTTNAPTSAPYNTSFTVAATASSSLTVAFTSSGACTNSGATYTITASSGTCSVIANQAGNTNYASAPTKTESTTATAATGSTLRFAPTSLNFGTVYQGNTALATLTITNSGTSMVTFTNFGVGAISGDDSTGYFGLELCPKTLNAGKSCTIIMSFTADSNVTKTHAANLVITDNASGSPQSILMSATVINPGVSLNPTSLSFGNQKSGTTSATKLVTLRNSGTTTLTLSKITISGNFASGTGGSCTNTSSLGANATCTIAIVFKPTSKGSKSGSVTIADNAKNSPQSVSLSGTGN